MHDPKTLQKLTLHQLMLGSVVVILTIGLLKLGQSVFMPMGLAICLSFILLPMVDRVAGWGLPRLVGSLLALGLTSAFATGVGALLSLSLGRINQRLPFYIERAEVVGRPLAPFLRRLHLSYDLDSLLNFFDKEILASFAGSSFLWIMDLLAEGTLVFFITLFILLEASQFRQKLQRAFGLHNLVHDSAGQIATQIQRYLLTKTLISLGAGLVVWGFLAWLGVDFALVWGFLAFLLNFIPNLGAVVASVPPVLVAILQFDDPVGYGLTASLGLLAIHMVIGNYIEPLVTGGSLNLSALVIFINLCFWGWLWGAMGMFISVPIIVAAKVTLSHIPATARIATLLDE